MPKCAIRVASSLVTRFRQSVVGLCCVPNRLCLDGAAQVSRRCRLSVCKTLQGSTLPCPASLWPGCLPEVELSPRLFTRQRSKASSTASLNSVVALYFSTPGGRASPISAVNSREYSAISDSVVVHPKRPRFSRRMRFSCRTERQIRRIGAG